MYNSRDLSSSLTSLSSLFSRSSLAFLSSVSPCRWRVVDNLCVSAGTCLNDNNEEQYPEHCQECHTPTDFKLVQTHAVCRSAKVKMLNMLYS